MSVDLFSRSSALKLLHNKQVWFFGASNARSIYKDLVWLLEYGSMVPEDSLRMKNEITHANDYKTTKSPLTSRRDYEETREYYNDAGTIVTFTFLAKMFSENLMRAFEKDSDDDSSPDVVVFNSYVWDLSRWGPNAVVEYKKHVVHTMEYFKNRLSRNCLVVFITTPPFSFCCKGGFLKKPVEFLSNQLPWHVVEANKILVEMATLYRYDVLDLHCNQSLGQEWSSDGIHWSPLGYRLFTNLILTHLALSFNTPLPGVYALDEEFIQKSLDSSCDSTVDNLSGKKRKEREVINSNEANKIRFLLKIEYDSGPASTSIFSVINECNNESTETEAVNVVHIQTKQVGADPKHLNVETNKMTTNQRGSVVEITHIVYLDNNEIVQKEDLSERKQFDSCVLNNNLVETNRECNNQKNINESNQLKVDTEINQPEIENNPVIISNLPHYELIETKQLTVDDTELIGNNESVVTNEEIVSTTPNKDLNLIDEPIKTNSVVDSQCFNEFTVENEFISTVLEFDTEQTETEHPDVVVETKGETEPTSPINLITNSQETSDFINITDFFRKIYRFAFFIEAFSPQLIPLE